MKAASWEIRKQMKSRVHVEALTAGGDVFLVSVMS